MQARVPKAVCGPRTSNGPQLPGHSQGWLTRCSAAVHLPEFCLPGRAGRPIPLEPLAEWTPQESVHKRALKPLPGSGPGARANPQLSRTGTGLRFFMTRPSAALSPWPEPRTARKTHQPSLSRTADTTPPQHGTGGRTLTSSVSSRGQRCTNCLLGTLKVQHRRTGKNTATF